MKKIGVLGTGTMGAGISEQEDRHLLMAAWQKLKKLLTRWSPKKR